MLQDRTQAFQARPQKSSSGTRSISEDHCQANCCCFPGNQVFLHGVPRAQILQLLGAGCRAVIWGSSLLLDLSWGAPDALCLVSQMLKGSRTAVIWINLSPLSLEHFITVLGATNQPGWAGSEFKILLMHLSLGTAEPGFSTYGSAG